MMEWVEATKFALKSSIRSELTNSMMKSSCYSTLAPQLNVDDFLCIAGVNGVLPSEDFSVDEFFDLPACENDDGRNSKDGYSDVLGEENEEDNVSGDQIDDDGTLANSSCEPLSAAELAVPADDMKELELWSHLMDDSVTESYSSYPNVSFPMETGFHQPEGHTQPEPFHSKLSLIPPGFPAKPRSKRPRTITGRTWSYGSAPKSESDSSSNSSSSPKSVLLLNNPFVQGIKLYGRPPTVKKPKKRATETSGSQLVVVQQRRCSHCLVTKTPQWRAGPTGPKTLCNACGVRFKSGRLFPEYRPACSPTFSSEMHSNSHRKVLEMRKKKEMVEPESESSSPIVDASCVLKKSGGPDEVAD